MARLSGIATSSTAASGSRNTPMATNTAANTKKPTKSRFLISGIIIRKTNDTSRPTAAQDTPARICLSVSTWPKRA
jgi:hypothetical protein